MCYICLVYKYDKRMSCFGSGVVILNILHADGVKKTSDLIENIDLCQDLNRYQKMIRTKHVLTSRI